MKPLFITAMAISFALTAAIATAGGPWASETTADQPPLEEIGRSLFYDPNLGGSDNRLSCGSCHGNGYLLKNADTNPNLMRAIRRCLINELSGGKDEGQINMKALRAYVLNLAIDLSAPENPNPDMLDGFRPGGPESRPEFNGFRPGNRGPMAVGSGNAQ